MWAGPPPDLFSAANQSEPYYAVAFVREPISRLISAWKDKLACGMYIPDDRQGQTGKRQTANDETRPMSDAVL